MTGRAEKVVEGATESTAFIVGMSRAGTTWLARSLHRHPEITVFGESAYWGRRHVDPVGNGYDEQGYRRLEELYADGLGLTEIEGADGGAAGLFRAVARQARMDGERLSPDRLYRRVCRRLGEREDSSVVVEKTPHHVHWVDRIMGALPDARLLVCLRDPYDFLLSYMHQGDRKPRPVGEMFGALYHPIVTSTVARRYLAAVLRVLDRHPDRTLAVRLEDVETDPDAVLAAVQEFLGVETVEGLDAGRQESSFPDRGRPELDPAELFWLNRLAGPRIVEAGYELRPAGPPRASWLGPLFTLPAASWRALRITARASERPLLDYLRGWFGLEKA